MKTLDEILRDEGRAEGMIRASRADVVDVLETRLTTVPGEIAEAVEAIDDLARLKALHRRAVTVPSLDAFSAELARVHA